MKPSFIAALLVTYGKTIDLRTFHKFVFLQFVSLKLHNDCQKPHYNQLSRFRDKW